MKGCPLLYCLGKFLTLLIAKSIFGYQVLNRNNIPRKGPFIIASNHISFYDPPLVGSATHRICHFFAKRELFRNRLFGWVLRRVNAIPVNRKGIDRESINAVVRVLQQGGGVVLFPEGTRSRNGSLMEMKPGVGLIALKSGAPIIPACIRNSEDAPRNRLTGRKVVITFAEPIWPDTFDKIASGKDGYRRVTDEVSRRIMMLKGELKESHLIA